MPWDWKLFHWKSEKFQFHVIEYHCGSIQSNFKKSPLGSYLMSCKAASYILLKWEKDFRAIGKTLNCFLCLHSLRHDSHIALKLLLPSLLTYWKYCWILLNQIRHIQRHTVQEIYCFFLCFLCIFGEMGHVVRVFSQFEKLSILVFAHFLFLQYRLNIFISGTMVKNHWLSSIEIQNLGIPKYGRKLVFVG